MAVTIKNFTESYDTLSDDKLIEEIIIHLKDLSDSYSGMSDDKLIEEIIIHLKDLSDSYSGMSDDKLIETIETHLKELDDSYSGMSDEVYTPFSIDTNAVSNIGPTTADGNGNITYDVGSTLDERGFVYDTSSHGDPGDVSPASSSYSDNINETGSFGTGVYSLTMNGLSVVETYYVRAYAHNSNGYSYGDEVSFDTPSLERNTRIKASQIKEIRPSDMNTDATPTAGQFPIKKSGQNLFEWADSISDYITDEDYDAFPPMENVVVVSQDSDYGDYDTISDAMASITDATDSNRYTILLAPGVYTETGISLKNYVSIVGLGEPENTIIRWDDTDSANTFTGGDSGISFHNLRFEKSAINGVYNVIEADGDLTFKNCIFYIDCRGSTSFEHSIISAIGWVDLDFYECRFESDQDSQESFNRGRFIMAGDNTPTINFYNCYLEKPSLTPEGVNFLGIELEQNTYFGTCNAYNSYIGCPINGASGEFHNSYVYEAERISNFYNCTIGNYSYIDQGQIEWDNLGSILFKNTIIESVNSESGIDIENGSIFIYNGRYYKNDSGSDISLDNLTPLYDNDEIDTKLGDKIDSSEKGSIGGIAELNSSGLLPTTQLPGHESTHHDGDSDPLDVKDLADSNNLLNDIIYRESFTDGDLGSADILSVNHGLGNLIVDVSVYDNNNVLIVADVTLIDTNNLQIDFSDSAPLTGTWNLIVIG